MQNQNLPANNVFYDQLSEYYDTMVSFGNLVSKRHTFLKEFATGYSKALDIGCGTGADSIALSQLGLAVTGIDPSEKMITKAVENANKENLKINFLPVSLIEYYHSNSENYDLIISLGNTFANISYGDLKEIFAIVYDSLTRGGTFLFQLLNYNRIMHKNDLFIGKFENEDYIIERKYLKSNDLIFNVTVTEKKTLTQHEYNTTIFPHIYPVIMNLCIETGFSRISVYGSDKLDTFDEIESKDLIVKVIK